jgi:hypothetical protein
LFPLNINRKININFKNMKKLLISILFVSALFTFNSCKKDQLVTVTGTATGNVTDYTSNAPIAGAVVSIVVDSATTIKATTSATGYYSLAGIPIGDHIMKITNSGFATEVVTISVYQTAAVAKTKKEVTTDISVANNIALHPTTGKITGQVTDVNNKPVSGATVSVIVGVEPLYTTTTDANGIYILANLPVGKYFTVTANSADASASSTVLATDLIQFTAKNTNIQISATALSLINYPGIGTNSLADTATSIVLTFSENLNDAITKQLAGPDFISVTKGGSNVLTTATITGSTITITFVDATAHLSSGSNYTINYSVYASATKSTSGSVKILTKEVSAASAIAPVIVWTPANTSTYPTIANKLQVTNPQTITNGTITYDIYRKYKDGTSNITDFEYFQSMYGSSSLSAIGGLSVGDIVYVKATVTGKDGNSTTAISNAVPIY